MSIIGSNILAGASGSGVSAYEIEQSLRFDGSSDLTRTPGSAGNRRTWTISTWVKKSNTTTNQQHIIGIPGAQSDNGYFQLMLHNDVLKVAGYSSTFYRTSELLRDYSAWYHIVIRSDTTSATASERLRVYINGVESVPDTTSQTITTVSQNFDWALNASSYSNHIGKHTTTYNYFGGYLSETIIVDGTSLHPDNFGEYDDNGVWRPVAYSGSYGTNGIYLKYDPSATNGIGHDHSGNGNNFTPSGFTTSGTGTDVMSDTPTTNWCTLNPLSYGPSNADMVEGNLRFNQPTATTGNAKGTIAVSSGKWYWEVTPQTTAVANVAGGILGAAETATNLQPGWYATGYSYYSTGETKHDGVDATYGDSYGAGDVIGTALDLDAGTLVFYKNGVSQGTAFSGLSGTFVPAIGDTSTGSGSQLVCNFGQRDFEYTPPTGFKALNTSNLPAPGVKEGVKHFSANTWTGNGTTDHALTGFGHQPDFVWGKARSAAYAHALFDSIRGGDKRVYNNGSTPPAQDTNSEYIKSFDSDGITLGSDANLNGNTVTYIGWSWKGGGTVSAGNNTTGDITATVSANPTAGFSVIKYTSSGTSGDTIGHGLGDAPAFFIVKNIDATDHYSCYHQGIGNGKALLLNSGNSAYTDTAFWNDTSPTSTVITLGNETSTNNSDSDDYICWAWAEIEGFSKFGTYQGSTNLPFIYCGFRPAFIILKPHDFGSGWYLYDSARGEYNVVSMRVLAESAAAETSAAGNDIDILSNGFRLRGVSNSGSNYNGKNYIFCAWAEHPFGGSGVSPATAR